MSESSEEPGVRLYAVEPGGPRRLALPPGARSAHQTLDRQVLGVYTGLRTFHHDRFLGVEEHLDRTNRCMELLGWVDRLERELVRRALATLAAESAHDDTFFRLDVLPDPPHGLETDARTFLSLSAVHPVPEDFLSAGVRVEVARGLERPDPRIKTADFAVIRRPYPLNRQDAYEHLLIDAEEHVLEATSANFYAVLDGAVRTARVDMLEGITRRFVLGLCEEIGLPVRLEAPRLGELPDAEEAFLTSSTRGVVPVVDVAGTRIGSGRPGVRTGELIEAYRRLIEREARPAWPA